MAGNKRKRRRTAEQPKLLTLRPPTTQSQAHPPHPHHPPAVADAINPPSPPHHPSHDLRNSRLAEQNGDCSPAAVGEDRLQYAAAVEAVPDWERVARVLPAMDAVVKVSCVHTEPNLSLPWQRKRQGSSSSSSRGF